VLSSARFDSLFGSAFAFSPDGRLAFAGTGFYTAGRSARKEPMRLSLWDLPEAKRDRFFDDSPWAAER
jgi:hypothetical protein